MSSPAPARRGHGRGSRLVSGEAAVLDGEWAARPLGRAAPRRPRPPRTRHGALRRHHPALAPRPGQALVPVPPGHRVRVRDHRRRGAGAHPGSPRSSPTRHPRPPTRARITRPVLEDYLSWLLAQGYSACHPGAVAVDDPGVLRRLPPPRLAARAGRQRHHLRRRAPLPPRPDRPVHPRVRDGPAGVRRSPGEDPAHHHPQPRRRPDRDRAARRGRLQPAVQPGARPTAAAGPACGSRPSRSAPSS